MLAKCIHTVAVKPFCKYYTWEVIHTIYGDAAADDDDHGDGDAEGDGWQYILT